MFYFITNMYPYLTRGFRNIEDAMTSYIVGPFPTHITLTTMTTFDLFSKEVKPRTLDNPDRTKEILKAFIKVGPIPQNGQYISLNPAIPV